MRALREALALAAPFWRSAERGKAWGLLGVVVALNLALVAMAVLLSYWNREFFNALEARDAARFQALLFGLAETDSGPMPGFAWIAAAYIAIAVYALYLRQALQIRWRRWITENLLEQWLDLCRDELADCEQHHVAGRHRGARRRHRLSSPCRH